MDIADPAGLRVSPLAAPLRSDTQPQFVADQRPSADAAALARDSQPEVPLPLPPGVSQTGAVGRSLLETQRPADQSRGPASADADTPRATAAAATGAQMPALAPGRTLKPFGIDMLPREFEAPQPREPLPQSPGRTDDAPQSVAQSVAQPAPQPARQAAPQPVPQGDRDPASANAPLSGLGIDQTEVADTAGGSDPPAPVTGFEKVGTDRGVEFGRPPDAPPPGPATSGPDPRAVASADQPVGRRGGP